MKRAVIIGGLNTGEKPLEAVAEAVTAQGFAEDAEVKTIYKARENPNFMRGMGKGTLGLALSMGISTVHPRRYDADVIVTYGAPEPKPIPDLVRSGKDKVVLDIKHALNGPQRMAHARIVGSNVVNFWLHPAANIREIDRARKFSAARRVVNLLTNNKELFVGRVEFTEDDYGYNFFTNGDSAASFANLGLEWEHRQDIDRRHIYLLSNGRHDELLINPADKLASTLPVILDRAGVE